VNDNNINEEWLDEHQWQPGMPSPDAAWNDMLAKLDKEMPVASTLSKEDNKRVSRNHALYLALLLLLFMNIKHTNENIKTQQANTQTKEAIAVNTGTNGQKQVPVLNNKSSVITSAEIIGDSLKSKQVLQVHKTHNNRHVFEAGRIAVTTNNNTSTEHRTPILYDTFDAGANDENALLNNKEPGIQKSKLNTVHPTDSSQSSEEEGEEKLLVQAGLQWTLPLPIAGTGNYFAGPSGNDQPWRVLLPGAWVSIKADKNILMAEVNPFETASFNPKSFYSNKEVDSSSILETFKSITKVFGVSGAISFQHNITGNWWAGGGIQANFWSKGAAILVVNEHNVATNTSSSTSKQYMLSKDDWKYFSKLQLYPHLQFMYRTNNYQAGLRAGLTFTSLAQDAGAKNRSFTELFFRLPLVSNKKR